MPDAHKNFAYSTVATPPSPAGTGTSLVVQAGDGGLFPVPPFNATVWPFGDQAFAFNAEIVRVTAISGDSLTIMRAQEGTSARLIGVNDQIAATITAKTLTDAEQGGIGSPQITVLTAGGTYTTPVGAKSLWVRLSGGGGGGGGGAGNSQTGGGGGSGGYCEGIITSPAASYGVTIGAGGTGGTAGQPGTAGGQSLFGTVLTANGGGGGGAGVAGGSGGAGGAGGTASGGSLSLTGGRGGTLTAAFGTAFSGTSGPMGGANPFGGAADTTNNGAANTGAGGGGGGSGGFAYSTTGGNGGSGVCIVVAYFF